MLLLSGLKPLSPHASFLNSNKLSSTIANITLNGSSLLTKKSGAIASFKDGHAPVNRSKYLNESSRSLGGRVRSHAVQNNDKVLRQIEQLMRVDIDQKNDRPQHLCRYNSLLKAGRLHKCVELLNDMEIKGILDMTKVYHAKFFNVCKRQKAVREAFDYTKLIPNPKLSTFNMLMTVCASSQDSEGAFQVLHLVQEAGLKPDCKLYTTLISTCANSGKVDQMFEVYHKMVNSGVEPNVHTYGPLIDGCARAGQVAKAFGAYGIMRSKKVKPDHVVFNALIAACAQSGAVDRAFDVLAEMAAEIQPIDPDDITLGSLMKACTNAGRVERARDVYKMIQQYNIKGTPELYTIAINSCSQTGDWEFACSVYSDMTGKGVLPDEMFLSALIDDAGHAGKLDAAFEVMQEPCNRGMRIGIMPYCSLMGACSNARNWQKALELYEDLKSLKLVQTVSVVNALITALCDGDQFQKAMEVLSEMKGLGLCPNSVTYSMLVLNDLEAGQMLLSQAKKDGIVPNLIMCRCIIGMCLGRFERACFLGEPVVYFNSGRPQVDNKWYLIFNFGICFVKCDSALSHEHDLMATEEWTCACDAATYKGKIEKERVFQFLAGLNKSLDDVRSRILSRIPLPSTREVFSEVRREASRCKVMLHEAVMMPTPPTDSTALTGHTCETCWEIHGKPVDWKPRKVKPRGYQTFQDNSHEQADDSSLPHIDKDQLGKLIEMLGAFQKAEPAQKSNPTASVAHKGEWWSEFQSMEEEKMTAESGVVVPEPIVTITEPENQQPITVTEPKNQQSVTKPENQQSEKEVMVYTRKKKHDSSRPTVLEAQPVSDLVRAPETNQIEDTSQPEIQ
ncbi:hypothetical protein L6164_037480 [Bauhinia variegata]|uniref:Uncharacterized protein n=1 Tax=Bauhinia variegata TaxID=167791 RepID=A0ACB9KK07_BAUVA|nr:hypothetical protein L6164_037480 [Bauhinia variegata]